VSAVGTSSAVGVQLARSGGPLSARRPGPARRVAAVVLCLVLVALGIVLSLALGSRDLPLPAVLRAVVAPDGSEATIIVRELRWPRTVIALVVGAALGVAGAQLQGLTRNPLAEPGLLGVSAGAALGVVATGSILGLSGALGQAAAAVLGAAAATVVVFALAGGPRRGPLPLVLSGVAVSALLAAITTILVLLDAETLDEYRFWAVGSVAGRDLGLLLAAAPLLALGALLAIATTRSLDLLALGEDVATGLGQRVAAGRLAVVASATLLTAGAVSVAGPLLLVGLVVPHLARGLVGAAHAWVLPSSALLGSALLLLSDVLGRVVARPGEVQVGIVTALVGAPFLVALVQRRRLLAGS
jgi:iron complex transport system permease protein